MKVETALGVWAVDRITEKYLERHRRKSRKAKAPKFFTCFFTGMTLPRKVDPFSGYTVEHIIPKYLLKAVPQGRKRIDFDKAQRVPAVSIINHMIGHAPIRVKFELRDYLKTIPLPDGDSDDEKLEKYVHWTRIFLEQYQTAIGDIQIKHMPWYYNSLVISEHREILFHKYYELLTTEEQILLALREHALT